MYLNVNKKIHSKYQKVGHPNEVLISAATENFYYNGAQIWQQIVLYEAFKAAKQGMRGLLKLSLLKWKINSDSILTVAGPKDPPPSNYDVFCYFQFLQQIHYFTLRWRFLIRTLSATIFIIGMTRSGIKLSWFHDIGAWLLLITGPVDVLSW